MKSFFITATGTNIGKTFLTTQLCEQLREQGTSVHAIKPVISGWDESDETTDTHQLLSSLGLTATPATIEALSPWRYAAPLSPDMAARTEGKEAPTLKALTRFCHTVMHVEKEKGTSYFFIEGVGGVMVPLNAHETQREWIKALEVPALLLTGSYLGTLSHTLTALAVLEQAEIPVAAVLVNETEGSTVGLEATAQSLRNFTTAQVVTLPFGSRKSIIEDILAILG